MISVVDSSRLDKKEIYHILEKNVSAFHTILFCILALMISWCIWRFINSILDYTNLSNTIQWVFLTLVLSYFLYSLGYNKMRVSYNYTQVAYLRAVKCTSQTLQDHIKYHIAKGVVNCLIASIFIMATIFICANFNRENSQLFTQKSTTETNGTLE